MTQSGWHFLQIPGPTNVPDRVLRALARPTIDHRGPEFGAMTLEIIGSLHEIERHHTGRKLIKICASPIDPAHRGERVGRCIDL